MTDTSDRGPGQRSAEVKNPWVLRINSAPEGFHTLWGQCKEGIYEKQAWNEYNNKLCAQTRRLNELEAESESAHEVLNAAGLRIDSPEGDLLSLADRCRLIVKRLTIRSNAATSAEMRIAELEA